MKLSSRTVQRTLAFINRIRAEQGRRPLKRMPKGDLRRPLSCPIATALTFTPPGGKYPYQGKAQMGYGRSAVIEYRDKNGQARRSHFTPVYVREFMDAFDDERIPELIR